MENHHHEEVTELAVSTLERFAKSQLEGELLDDLRTVSSTSYVQFMLHLVCPTMPCPTGYNMQDLRFLIDIPLSNFPKTTIMYCTSFNS